MFPLLESMIDSNPQDKMDYTRNQASWTLL